MNFETEGENAGKIVHNIYDNATNTYCLCCSVLRLLLLLLLLLLPYLLMLILVLPLLLLLLLLLLVNTEITNSLLIKKAYMFSAMSRSVGDLENIFII